MREWAATTGRITVSLEVGTVVYAANKRVATGLALSVRIVSPQSLGVGNAIRDLRFGASM